MDISARFLAFTTYGVQWVLWLLIGLSVISIGMMLERLWHFATHRPSPQKLAKEMRALLQSGAARQAGSEGAGAAEALEGAVEGAKAGERLQLERNLAFLGTLGSNAPFIGLFGTVLGIIKAFHDLAGNQAGGPAVVMAGISEALVATAVGLMVAIPAVVAFNYFNRRVRTLMIQVDWMTHLALAEVKAEYSQSAAAGTPVPTTPAEPPASVLPARSLLQRLVPVAIGGAIVLVGAGVLLGRSTSPEQKLAPTAPGTDTIQLAGPGTHPLVPPPAGSSTPALPAATGPTTGAPAITQAAGTSASGVPTAGTAAAGTAGTTAAGTMTPGTMTAGAGTAGAGTPGAKTPGNKTAGAGTPGNKAAGAKTLAVKAPGAAAPGAKPASPATPGGNKLVRVFKGKKRRPAGAAPAAAPGPAGAAPAKAEEAHPAPAKAEESAPAAPAVP